MKPRVRVFRYASELTRQQSSVDRWEWTEGRGLRCYYTAGNHCKSGYTLPELLRQPDGPLVEVVDGQDTYLRPTP